MRRWIGVALALLIALGSTSLVVKTAAYPERSWVQLAAAAAHYAHRTFESEWAKAFASREEPAARDVAPGKPQTASPITYEIEAKLDPQQHQIRGRETVEWREPLPSPVHFYLYPLNPGGIQVHGVYRDGKSVPYQVLGEQLLIQVGSGTSKRLTLEFTTDIPSGGTRYGERDGVWILAYWYPILASLDQTGWITPPPSKGFGEPYIVDTADYRVTWTAPKGMTWYASAPAQSAVPSGDGTVTVKMDGRALRNFALVGSAGYQDTTLTLADGLTVHLGLLAPEHRVALEATATAALNLYRARFGPLPTQAVALVETPPGTTFAQELPNLALIDVDLWNGQMPEQDADRWTAHELAHLWWYSAVGDYEGLTPWMDEGLADYSSYLYEESRYGPEAYEAAMNRLTSWFREGRSYSPGHPGVALPTRDLGATERPYEDFDTEWQYYFLEYLRPVLMYRDLRQAMGDDRFFSWLQTLYRQHVGEVLTADRWRDSLQQADPAALERANLWLDAPYRTVLRQLDPGGNLHPANETP
ncbi:hypothetical protein CVV65_16160 [Kyrpidia spormannii]|uniref:Peptidase M1 membrane alanine aminopeptidase domain-containing protein n=1 Tax=Kyrpidia spormannii TaxID=2055160 RepID=A0A2K8NAB8_9BACL|nr:hypothetical protein [Kyrpidia spormannii]ATY86271.1 hypothetical protein CVV65_16160 [Kyrpidia spormannii]